MALSPEKQRAYHADPVNRARRNARAQARRDAWTPEEREAAAAYFREWRKTRTPEQVEQERARRRRSMRVKKGTADASGEMRHGPCDICHRVLKLNFDHDHSTGEFRGWLCTRCNTGLGHYERFGDAFAEYLTLRR